MKMTKSILMTCAATALVALQADAKIWRVNNNGYNADFAQINEAVADPNVLAGDTLHVEGSTVEYNSATITKTLTIMGAGYYLADNPKTSNNGLATNSSYITFSSGSENSQLMGMSVNSGSGISINVSNITIKRNKIKDRIHLTYGISNITIAQNFFENTSSTYSAIAPSSSGFPSNLRFNNNIVQRPLVINDNATYTFLECNNNIFDLAVVPTSGYSLQFYAASFKNNILVNSTASVKINGITDFTATPNAAVSHNIGTSSVVHFGTANDNLVISNISSIWNTATAASPDGKYQLANNSAASGSGYAGVDRGAFGGAAVSNRYTLSGLAPIPVIYEVSTSGVATPSTGLDITIKSRTIE